MLKIKRSYPTNNSENKESPEERKEKTPVTVKKPIKK